MYRLNTDVSMVGETDGGKSGFGACPDRNRAPMDPRLRHFRGIASRVPGYVVGCGRIEDTNKARPTPLIAESAWWHCFFAAQLRLGRAREHRTRNGVFVRRLDFPALGVVFVGRAHVHFLVLQGNAAAAGTLEMTNALPAMIEPSPITVSPPSTAGVAVDGDVVLDGGMALHAGQRLAGTRGQSAQRNAW